MNGYNVHTVISQPHFQKGGLVSGNPLGIPLKILLLLGHCNSLPCIVAQYHMQVLSTTDKTGTALN